MKKLIFLLCMLFLLFTFTACSGNKGSSSNKPGVTDDIKNGVNDMMDGAKDMTDDMMDGAKNFADDMMNGAKDMADNMMGSENNPADTNMPEGTVDGTMKNTETANPAP